MNLFSKLIMSPVGRLNLICNEVGLVAILWENDNPRRIPLRATVLCKNHPILTETESQLHQYFSKDRREFTIPLDFKGTEFQKEVWRALLSIPYGETRSYRDIAVQIERPSSMRAVGSANGRNPISIIAPCHRVIGSDGKLTGFAGGLEVKEFLLRLEQKQN